MRKLVTIRKIAAIIPIENCDNISLALIDGWTVIIKNTEFQVGDFAVFFEIDSFIPAKDTRFAFLKKTTTFEGKEGYRLKTMKMKGVLSQGLALPIWYLGVDYSLAKSAYESGEDLAETFNIIKYDNATQELDQRPGLKSGKPRGSFPSFIPKTDQDRIQNLVHLWSTLPTDSEFEETLKLDGSSMTCYKVHKPLTWWDKIKQFFGKTIPDYHFGVCSRNLELSRDANQVHQFNNDGRPSEYSQSDFWRTAIKYNIESKLPVGYAVQGELIGPRIQANHEKVTELQYYVFDVFDIDNGLYLLPEARREFCAKYDIQHVPVVNVASRPLSMTLQELLKSVEGPSMNPGTNSEGRVYKHNTSQLSFKAISNLYLLKSEQ